jgi:hypothetical protein
MRVIDRGDLRLGRTIVNKQQAADVLTFPQLGIAGERPSRTLRAVKNGGLTAILDRRSPQRPGVGRSGRRDGPSVEQRDGYWRLSRSVTVAHDAPADREVMPSVA